MLHRSTETLAEIFGVDRAPKDLFTSTVVNVSPKHTVYRSSEDSSTQLPLVVEPFDHDLEDFFVSVSAFYQSSSPVTAFAHVLDKECSSYFGDLKASEIKKNEVGSRTIYGALGAAVGETILASLGSATNSSEPSYASCKRSAAYTLTRAKLIYPSCKTEYVADKWVRHRHITGLAVSDEVVGAVNEVLSLLFASDPMPSKLLPEELHAYVFDAGSEKAVLQMLTDLYPGIEAYLPSLRGSFDGRMQAFNSLTQIIHTSSHGSSFDSLAIGFFANRIQPGSFAHAKALTKLVEFFPTALVWYGAFCGLSEEFSSSDFAFGLVAKLERDARQPFSFDNRPSCDVSLEELQVLLRLPVKTEAMKPSQQKIALIALLPGVEIFSRLSFDGDSIQQDYERPLGSSVPDEVATQVTMLLEDALSLIRHRRSSSRRSSESGQKRQGKK